MTNPQEEFDEDGNLIVQETTDTIDYKAQLEKERTEKEKRENRFKSTAKELNEIKSKTQTVQDEDDGVTGANEYLKNHWVNVLKEQWFISKDDLASYMQKELQTQRDIEKLDKFPQLATQKDAILQLSKVDWLSIEETIKKYKFIDDDSMANFHKPTIGTKKKTPWTIDLNNPTEEDIEFISKMSSEEYEKFIGSK